MLGCGISSFYILRYGWLQHRLDCPSHNMQPLLGLLEQGLDVGYDMKQALGAVSFSTNARH